MPANSRWDLIQRLCPTADILLQQVLSRDPQGPSYLLNTTRLVLKHRLTQILCM